MSVKITSSLFYDRFTSLGGGGVPYFNGNFLDRTIGAIHAEVFWNLKNASVTFSASDSSITLTNKIDSRTFISQEFKPGDLFTIVDTASNDGDYTIDTISDTGLVITTIESLNDEDSDNASFHGTTPITSMEYKHNLIKNGANENYFSLTDPQTEQRFIVSDLDASDTAPVSMIIGTKSYAWVDNVISDAATGTTSQMVIKGDGISDFKQKFIILISINFTAPVYLANLFPNFSNKITPEIYSQNGLKYICSIGMKFNGDSPVIDHVSGITSQNGYNSWLDQASKGSRPQYYIESVSYEDDSDSSSLDRLDVNKDVLVTAVYKSRSGLFSDANTKVSINFNIGPSAESDYQNTQTTLIENFFIDNAFATVGDTPINGETFGTAYQSITAFEAEYVDANTINISFVFKAGTALKTYWESKSDDDRFYLLTAITQNHTISDTGKSDRNTSQIDFQSADWDKQDSSLSAFTGTGLKYFEFPDTGNTPIVNIDCIEGDKGVITCGFYVDNKVTDGLSATFTECSFQVIAQKTGENDFVFEQTRILTSIFPKVLGIQNVDISQDRGFITYEDDPTNLIIVARDPDNDATDKPAYIAQYGFAARYEYWVSALDQFQILGYNTSSISKSFDTVTQRWSQYSNIEGWNLFFRFNWSVVGTSGFENKFFTQIPITVNETNQNKWPSGSGLSTPVNKYYSWDPIEEVEIEQIDSIDIDGPVKVKATFTGNYALPIDGNGWHGFLFISPDNGGISNRCFASSEIASEENSPWSTTPEDVDADYSISNGNARINIYLDSMDLSIVIKIIVESVFDSSLYDALVENTFPVARLGVLYNSTVS